MKSGYELLQDYAIGFLSTGQKPAGHRSLAQATALLAAHGTFKELTDKVVAIDVTKLSDDFQPLFPNYGETTVDNFMMHTKIRGLVLVRWYAMAGHRSFGRFYYFGTESSSYVIHAKEIKRIVSESILTET